jgi:hypothetical protein
MYWIINVQCSCSELKFDGNKCSWKCNTILRYDIFKAEQETIISKIQATYLEEIKAIYLSSVPD